MNRIILSQKIDKHQSIIERVFIRENKLSPFHVLMTKDKFKNYRQKGIVQEFDIVLLHNRYVEFINKNGLNLIETKFYTLRMINFFRELIVDINDQLTANKKHIGLIELRSNINTLIESLEEELDNLSEVVNSKEQTNDIPPQIEHEIKTIETIAEPIWWTGSARQLGFLIEELEKAKLININGEINKVIIKHFIDKNKKPFPESIKQNRSKPNKPKGHDTISSIIKNTKEK